MSDPTVVRLSTLRLWQEPARFQAYPAFLLEVDDDASYESMADLARRAGKRRMLDRKHVKDDGITRNMGDYERNSRGEFVWRGLGLFEKRNGRYVLSSEGHRLKSSYAQDMLGSEWRVLLARLILRREPRTRAIVRALSPEGAELRFQSRRWFEGSHSRALLTGELGDFWPLNPGSSGQPNIQTLLNRLGAWALGDWRKAALGDEGEQSVLFAGVRDPMLTVDDLGAALHAPFELFRGLGLTNDDGGTARWSGQRAADVLGPDLATDFGWTPGEIDLPDLMERLLEELRAGDGYVVASELRQRLRAAGVEAPDRELAAMVDSGSVIVQAWDYGQSRHGEGLFGDDRKQLVKLQVKRPGGRDARDVG